MKYLSSAAVSWAVKELGRSHPFIGITFLSCKQANLPIGRTKSLSLDNLTKKHLNAHHRLAPQSEFYFQPFKSTKKWVSPRYPSSGLQAINTQTFSDVFIHEKHTKNWGFRDNYVDEIKKVIKESSGHEPIPLSAVAIWLCKNDGWDDSITLQSIIEQFLDKYAITPAEKPALFTSTDSWNESRLTLLDERPLDWQSVVNNFGPPPDTPDGTEGTLVVLHLHHVGPADSLTVNFGERLTLISGDNGLGKSFLLDGAWWAATGRWVDKPAFPVGQAKTTNPTISFELHSNSHQLRKGSIIFDWKRHQWLVQDDRPLVSSALCVYARVDGSFAVYDETRATLQAENKSSGNFFTSDEISSGKAGEIEGLVRDWVNWQLAIDQTFFSMLTRVLERLSPEDLGTLQPGEPTRLPGDPRQIPTIRHPYGDVPILYASAGVRRILLLAYMIIWSWQEHSIAAQQIGEEPTRKLVVLVDEIEAHLHPRWQRTILPALMSVGKLLSPHLETQIIISTHSPMVLASLESDFNENADVLYHLILDEPGVTLGPLPFHKYGDASAWLTSPVFGLRHARSLDAETAIESAKSIQLSQTPDASAIQEISRDLRRLLAPDDPFWPRWTFFAEQFGGNS